MDAGEDLPGRHHHEPKGHEDTSEPHTERDNQEESESHPVEGDGTEEDHQRCRTGDNPPGDPQGQQRPAGDGVLHGVWMMQGLVSPGVGVGDSLLVERALGVGMGVTVGMPMGMGGCLGRIRIPAQKQATPQPGHKRTR